MTSLPDNSPENPRAVLKRDRIDWTYPVVYGFLAVYEAGFWYLVYKIFTT